MADENGKSDRYTLDNLSLSELHFIHHCVIYTLCCMSGIVQEAIRCYNDAKIEINNLGPDGISNLQKKILASAGVELNEENVRMIGNPNKFETETTQFHNKIVQ